MAAPQRPPDLRSLLSLSPVASDVSRLAAQEMVDATPRRKGIPVRKSFIRRDDGGQPPLSDLYRGGQSGIVAIRLYLALIWRSSAGSYSTAESARAWATLLDLADPGGLGQRRVTRAVHALESRNLIEVDRSPGKVPEITVLDESGSGEPYETPSTQYAALEKDKDRQQQHWYFKVPTGLWVSGQIQQMTGPGLIMLLILLAERADKGRVWFAGDEFNKRYWISHKTRTEGTRELLDRNLLIVTRQPVKTRPGMTVFTLTRQRHVYRLRGAASASADKKTPAVPQSKGARKPKQKRAKRLADASSRSVR